MGVRCQFCIWNDEGSCGIQHLELEFGLNSQMDMRCQFCFGNDQLDRGIQHLDMKFDLTFMQMDLL
jgi:hypothetical protein